MKDKLISLGYEYASRVYEDHGIDVEKAMRACQEVPVSMHCWQGDDVCGFERADGGASGGIATTGNYPTAPEPRTNCGRTSIWR